MKKNFSCMVTTSAPKKNILQKYIYISIGYLLEKNKELIIYGIPKVGTVENGWQCHVTEAGQGIVTIPSYIAMSYTS